VTDMSSNALEGFDNQSDEFAITFVTAGAPFTNWSAHQIVIWGKRFATVEHAYQYRKFIETDPHWALVIKNAKSPWQARRLSRQHSIIAEQWDTQRVAVMRELLTAKVFQHEDVREALRKTGNMAIIEKGREGDSFWGVGPDEDGQNTLGKIWIVLRQQI
jgi:ribA/ribD-fused uncharacterized protein